MAKSNAQRQQEWRDRQKAKKLAAQPKPPPRGRSKEANAIIKYARELTVPPGEPLAGQPFKMGSWQQTFLRGALAAGVKVAGLSCARRNGKSGLIAVMLAAYLTGPLNRPNWRGLVVSLTANHSRLLLDQVEDILMASELLDGVKFKHSSPGRIEGLQRARVDFLSSDKSTGHGSSADLVIIDEAGLLEPNGVKLWTNVEYALGSRGGRLICISVRGHCERFAALADRAKDDPAVFWQEHAAPEGCAIDDRSAWAAANPGLAAGVKDLETMASQARGAKLSPSDEVDFRTFQLNQTGHPDRETIVPLDLWKQCLDDAPPPRSGPAVLGIDIGGSVSMCAAAAIWPETMRLEMWCALPGNPSPAKRGQSDRVGGRYVNMVARGELWIFPGRITPVEGFLGRLADDLEGTRILVCGADRFRAHALADAMQKLALRWPVEWRATAGTGKSDAKNDLIAFQRQVNGERLKCKPHIGMAAAIMDSFVKTDDAGNQQLSKKHQSGRIDVLQAAVIASGLWERYGKTKARSWVATDGVRVA